MSPRAVSWATDEGDVEAAEVWGFAYARVYVHGRTPAWAAAWAISRIKEAFAKYPIATV